jgi:predicted MFS family arabinose efflux permease
MITITVISFYMEKHLGLNYPSIANYKTIGGIVTILFLPIFGRLLDNTDPRKFASLSFLFMLFYVVFVLLTGFLDYNFIAGNFHIYISLFIAFIFFGLFAASNTLAWHIGSAFFSKDRNDAADYQAIHLILTGVRGLFAPLLGVVFYQTIGYTYTFLIAILFIIFAILILRWSASKINSKSKSM